MLEGLGLAPDPRRLEEALTHPSFVNENKDAVDNQRLEFLGDAVLGLCATDLLMARYPEAPEGDLSRMRAAVVRGEALSSWGRHVGMGEELRTSRGVRNEPLASMLADAVEAVIGAVYAELGLEAARSLVHLIVTPLLSDLDRHRGTQRDPKGELQERIQARGGGPPTYRTLSVSGPDHQRTFEVEVEVAGAVLSRGAGPSRKKAEAAAALAALSALEVREEPT